LRAGLWPRLNRDDSQWLPLKTIRAGRGGAIEGNEGLLSAIEDVHRRFALQASRADLRGRLASADCFIELLRELRQFAARRALLSEPPYPLPILCLDQAEELFAVNAGRESEKLLGLARAAIDGDAALLLFTIRSDAYGLMQSSPALAGIDQVPLSLGPVPNGEIARIIREPAEILRRKVGPSAPLFDAAVIERLQAEIEGETDSLPLLAFVLQRLMREHAGKALIGLAELERTGGVAAAIESAAEGALVDAGVGPDRIERRDALRRLFIPRLAQIDRDSKAFQRRVSRYGELPDDLLALARALTERRLLVVKAGARLEAATEPATLEVAHEALLRRWPTLADLLAEERDALLLLDGVLNAAADWEKAEAANKPDFLAHRGSRLADALGLAARGQDWMREVAPALAYLAACQTREAAERAEKEQALAREQARLTEMAVAQKRTARLQSRARWMMAGLAVLVVLGYVLVHGEHNANLTLQTSLDERQVQLNGAQADLGAAQVENKRRQRQLDRGNVQLLAELATGERLRDNLDTALRLSVHAERTGLQIGEAEADGTLAPLSLVSAVWQSDWRLVLDSQQQPVASAAFSPDGSRIVTTPADGTARIWDAATGKELMVLRGHQLSLWSAVFSPDGSRIVTTSADKTARIWDVATGEQLMVLRGQGLSLWSAAFSPDGSRIVTADDPPRIWDAATGEQVMVLGQHTLGLHLAAFSPDGSRIVTAENTPRVWDAATGREIMALSQQPQDARSETFSSRFAAFSADGARIVTVSDDRTATIWDAATGKELVVLRGHDDAVLCAGFSPDGMRVVTASGDKTARIWDATTGKALAVLRGHENSVQSAAFSPDGSQIVTASTDGTARTWNAAAGTEITVMSGHEASVSFVSFSPDGKRIASASQDKTVRVWDWQEGSLPRGYIGMQVQSVTPDIASARGRKGTAGVLVVAALPNGPAAKAGIQSDDIIASIDDRTIRNASEFVERIGAKAPGTAVTLGVDRQGIEKSLTATLGRRYVSATGKELMVLRGHDGLVDSAVFSPDGKRIVTAAWDNTARIWDATTGKELTVLRGHRDSLKDAAFSPDGTRIVTASLDETARIWDAATGQELMVLRGHTSLVNSAAFSPDGAWIVTASSDNTARIWDSATGKEIRILSGHDSMVNSAMFSPDGARIVTASSDNTARIWNATTGKEVAILRGHESYVTSAAFSPGGKRIVTASWDGSARIWDAATGTQIAVLRGSQGSITSAAFSPDGTRIATASRFNTVHLWDVHFATMPAKELITEVCTRRLRGLTTLTRDEMRLAGYADDVPEIDVCAGTGPAGSP